MSASSPTEITQPLQAWSNGDKTALDKLVPIVYEELRRIARYYMRRERPGHTLQTSALINEAYLRLVDQKVQWKNRSHFFGIAAHLMRRILIDHARSDLYVKRGGDQPKVPLDEAMFVPEQRAGELVALDDALKALATIDPRQSRIIELRFFGGLTIEETAEALNVSHTIVERESSLARAWLQCEISR
jgi:RNA polymerase sigma factor (TIGR02999 family)